MVRRLAAAEVSLANIRDLRKFGIAIAAMMRMIATTTNNSMRENPISVLPRCRADFCSEPRMSIIPPDCVDWSTPRATLHSMWYFGETFYPLLFLVFSDRLEF